MKTMFSGSTAALLLAGTMHIQSAHADLHAQPAPESSVEIILGAAPATQSPIEERIEERLRERLYGSGSEEWREERVREGRRARDHCHRMPDPTEREDCLDDLQ